MGAGECALAPLFEARMPWFFHGFRMISHVVTSEKKGKRSKSRAKHTAKHVVSLKSQVFIGKDDSCNLAYSKAGQDLAPSLLNTSS